MTRYILAHWRGELSMARSFLVNGVLGFVVLGLGVPGLGQLITLRDFVYVGMAVWIAWEIWAVVGIVRCAFRVFRKPRPHTGLLWTDRGLAVLALAVVVLFVYGTIADMGLMLKAAGRAG
jgi:hypothetical protein